MFDDVTEVRPAYQSLYKPARAAFAATVFAQARQERYKALDKARNVIALSLGQSTQMESHHQHGLVIVNVRACQRPDLVNPHDRFPLLAINRRSP